MNANTMSCRSPCLERSSRRSGWGVEGRAGRERSGEGAVLRLACSVRLYIHQRPPASTLHTSEAAAPELSSRTNPAWHAVALLFPASVHVTATAFATASQTLQLSIAPAPPTVRKKPGAQPAKHPPSQPDRTLRKRAKRRQVWMRTGDTAVGGVSAGVGGPRLRVHNRRARAGTRRRAARRVGVVAGRAGAGAARGGSRVGADLAAVHRGDALRTHRPS